MLDAKDPLTGEGLDDENIRNQLVTFLIAGHETTSGLLSFATYLLLENPHVLETARERKVDIIGLSGILAMQGFVVPTNVAEWHTLGNTVLTLGGSLGAFLVDFSDELVRSRGLEVRQGTLEDQLTDALVRGSGSVVRGASTSTMIGCATSPPRPAGCARACVAS